MKKVRFESSVAGFDLTCMNDTEIHSPRPFIEKAHNGMPQVYDDNTRLVHFSNDPVQRFECSNSSPYSAVKKTNLVGLHLQTSRPFSTTELELSMLDSSICEPRKPIFPRHIINKPMEEQRPFNTYQSTSLVKSKQQVLLPIENDRSINPPNVLNKDNEFFLKRDDVRNGHIHNIKPLQNHFNQFHTDKENNNPLLEKAKIKTAAQNLEPHQNFGKNDYIPSASYNSTINNGCSCHHCVRVVQNIIPNVLPDHIKNGGQQNCCPNIDSVMKPKHLSCPCVIHPHHRTFTCNNQNIQTLPECFHTVLHFEDEQQLITPKLQNAADKKTWAIEKYEQSKNSDCKDVKKLTNLKEKREPTVSDLFKIIKLQNEQLQLLQEKVDKFISSKYEVQNVPSVQNFTAEQVAIGTNKEENRVSIGVMTSFEMVRTSTIINKEVIKQKENAQIQCNRSQISIKEVISKSQPVNLNFLDGITPSGKNLQVGSQKTLHNAVQEKKDLTSNVDGVSQQCDNVNDEKTLNELSLYNIQVDNATTPQISPEQSLYLDVRDYSDSESGSDDESNVGWTYYNKVMTHVNGMLQDSDMPSSASALYRNTRQQCLQMQIDKTNFSLTKRVKFGDDPLGLQQPHIYAASTDTSVKMNQLAAKYLKNFSSPVVQQQPAPLTTASPLETSFATRNYMERYQLLQGTPSHSPPLGDMPRFLDITALKRQPKLL